MTKIKFLTDSNCDIPLKTADELGIEILPFTITIDGTAYRESYSFTPPEYYKILENAEALPVTAQIPPAVFRAKFSAAYDSGYDCVILTTMTAVGSGTFSSANVGRQLFYEEHPEARSKFDIHVIDSGNYSISYGYGILRAAQAYRNGAEVDEVLDLIHEWFGSLETYFTVFTLKYVRLSGRIGGAVQAVCDLLGICPVMSNLGGVFRTIKKTRGKHAAVRYIAEMFQKRWNGESDYVVLRGITDDAANELAALLEALSGKPPVGIFYAGPSISTNTGPYITGIGFMAKER
ncbi:MAG: DegV family protein [Oscillospiraceae bacterium]